MDKTAKIRMKAKRNVTDLAGEKVMVDFEQGKYFCIKGVGNDIWDMLDGQEGEDGITVEAILHKLMEEYEVMEEVCEKEVLAFLEKLEQAGIERRFCNVEFETCVEEICRFIVSDQNGERVYRER